MEYWHFSEMPYPFLPSPENYDSIRVTMPSSYMEPETAADLMSRYIKDWTVADKAGINIMINEHHGTATCMNSAAPLMAAALSQVTVRAKILILGNPVANRRDPVRVAEEMALLDLMTRGRLEVGFVRGVPYEISATNSSPTKMNERMWEAIDLIRKTWTNHNGPFNWEGAFFQHRQVNIWPRPYTQPHPPIWVTAMSQSSVPLVADADAVAATFLTGVEGTKRIFDSYRSRWHETGKGEVPLDRFGYAAMTFVGETDAEGMAGAEQLMWYLKSNKVPQEFILPPPGYSPYFARAGGSAGRWFGLRPCQHVDGPIGGIRNNVCRRPGHRGRADQELLRQNRWSGPLDFAQPGRLHGSRDSSFWNPELRRARKAAPRRSFRETGKPSQ